MKVLLDECIPRKFQTQIVGHNCVTVPDSGFTGKKNGKLLRLAVEAGFEAFVTLDRGIEYQQIWQQINWPSSFFEQNQAGSTI